MDDGKKMFNSAWEAAEQLKHLGINARLPEAELVMGWPVQFRPGQEQLTRTPVWDIKGLSNE